VRNSENTVVQFAYGNDGLDPIMMESNGPPTKIEAPVHFVRLLDHTCATHPCAEENALEADALADMATQVFSPAAFAAHEAEMLRNPNVVAAAPRVPTLPLLADTSPEFCQAIHTFLMHRVTQMQATKLETSLLLRIYRLTATQLRVFLEQCAIKYARAMIQPGTTVGAIAGQSIGEPGTQHFFSKKLNFFAFFSPFFKNNYRYANDPQNVSLCWYGEYEHYPGGSAY
jgi:DNA-directed RNA polymerase III subunit RPC1